MDGWHLLNLMDIGAQFTMLCFCIGIMFNPRGFAFTVAIIILFHMAIVG